MESLVLFTLVVFALLNALNALDSNRKYSNSFINPYPRYKFYNDGDDPGEPLFLTPLINDPKMDKGKIREMARVEGSQFLGVESYSGYLTISAKYNSNTFFWYFPAEKHPENASVVLWLQGGPGASSLYGLFVENGPFKLNTNGSLRKRYYTWSRENNLIYIDNPIGSGFSFTEHDDGYARNENEVGSDLHEAVMQLYELFEWSNDSGFWITGESYAGKYVPALAYHIHLAQNTLDARVHIPLKGMAIGNGFSDPLHQVGYAEYLYQLGLIDEHGFKQVQDEENKGVDCIKKRDMVCAFDIFNDLISGDLTNGSIFKNLTGFDFYFNFLKTYDDGMGVVMGKYLQSSTTRRAIHVGNKTFHDLDTENIVEKHLKSDIMDSVASWMSELLSHYKVFLYNGQLDIIVAYPLTRNYLMNLKFEGSDKYKIAPRKIWRVDDEIAGYVKIAGNLVDIMIRNAGHMVPTDQPKWMYKIIHTLTNFKKLI